MSETHPAPEDVAVDRVDWLPSGARSGLIRVRGRRRAPGELPVLVLEREGTQRRFTSLPDSRAGADPLAWRGAYVLDGRPGGADVLWLDFAGRRVDLPASDEPAAPGPAAAPPAAAEDNVVDRAVLAERRARRAEASEQAQARIAEEAMRAVEVLEARTVELEAQLGKPGRPALTDASRESRAAAEAAEARAVSLEADNRALRAQLVEAIRVEPTDAERRAARLRTALTSTIATVAELRMRLHEAEVARRTREVGHSAAAVQLAVLLEERSIIDGALTAVTADLRTAQAARDEALTARVEAEVALQDLRERTDAQAAELAAAAARITQLEADLAAAEHELDRAVAEAVEAVRGQTEADAAGRAGERIAAADALTAEAERALEDLRDRLDAAEAARELAEAAAVVAAAERQAASVASVASTDPLGALDLARRRLQAAREAAATEAAAPMTGPRRPAGGAPRTGAGGGLQDGGAGPPAAAVDPSAGRADTAAPDGRADAGVAQSIDAPASGLVAEAALAPDAEGLPDDGAVLTDAGLIHADPPPVTAQPDAPSTTRTRRRWRRGGAGRAAAAPAPAADAQDAPPSTGAPGPRIAGGPADRVAEAESPATTEPPAAAADPSAAAEPPATATERASAPESPAATDSAESSAAAAAEPSSAPGAPVAADFSFTSEPSAAARPAINEPTVTADEPASAERSSATEPQAAAASPAAADPSGDEPAAEAPSPGTGGPSAAATEAFSQGAFAPPRAPIAPPSDDLRQAMADQARVARSAESVTEEQDKLVADLDAAAAGLRAAPAPADPTVVAPEAEAPAAGPTIVSPASDPPSDVARGRAGRDYPALRGALVKLAHDDPAAAARLLVGLLRAQHAVNPEAADYDVSIAEAGTYAIHSSGEGTDVVAVAKPRGRPHAAFHLRGDAVGLAELIAGVGAPPRRLRGTVRASGRTKDARRLTDRLGDGLTLSDVVHAGADLEPELILRGFGYAVRPAWTSGQGWAVEIVVDGTPHTVTVSHGGGMSARRGSHDGEPDARLFLNAQEFRRLVAGAEQPLRIEGDKVTVGRLMSLVERARALGQ